LNCSSFDEYVNNLEGAWIRRNIRRNLKKAQQDGIQVERATPFAQYSPLLNQLAQNVFAYHNNAQGYRCGPDFFSVVEQECADNSAMFLARVGQEIVGFLLALHDRGVMLLYGMGRDYRFENVYHILFYEALRYAIEQGIPSVMGGQENYTYKERLGFQKFPSHTGFMASNRVLNWLGKRIAGTARDEADRVSQYEGA
jgi:predicted N-acyltransferase